MKLIIKRGINDYINIASMKVKFNESFKSKVLRLSYILYRLHGAFPNDCVQIAHIL